MSLTACVLCHHEELRPRWVGDLLMTYCDRCGCLYVPEPTPPALTRDPLPQAAMDVQLSDVLSLVMAVSR